MTIQNVPNIQPQGNRVDRADIVIVGNGIAGLTAAVEARRLAPDKRVLMITDQSHPTINTPALKQYAIGKLSREQLLAYPAGTERAQLIHVINARAEEIHAREHYLTLRGGRALGYGSLLIATGSAPVGLPAHLPGRDFDGILTLHRLNDYLDLRRRLGEIEEAVVIGGGAHAIETVMCLMYWGIRVHWLIRGDTFLSKMLDRPASNMVLDSIRRGGVSVYTETEVVGIVGRVGAVAGVVTNHQQLLPCQLVLVCTGTTALTSLARHCDLPMQHTSGIVVDDQLRTSTLDIYAAGDVAAIRDPQTGQHSPRAQWYAAVLQGRIAAASMMGAASTTGTPHVEGFGVPWHATRLGDISMLSVGSVLRWQDNITTLTDSSRGSYRRICVLDDRLVGYLSLGSVQPDSLAIKRIIDEGLSIRDIKKNLLRGTFDARKYFSSRRTFAAQRMVSTGKLPVEIAPRPLSTRKLSAPTVEGRPAVPAVPAALQPVMLEQTALVDSGKLLARVLPTTGPLPASTAIAAQPTQQTGEYSQLFAEPFVTTPVEAVLSPVQPPAQQRPQAAPPTRIVPQSQSVQQTPEPRPASTRARPKQFKAPPKSRKGRFIAPPADVPNREAYPSSSLWSYSDKIPVPRKGR